MHSSREKKTSYFIKIITSKSTPPEIISIVQNDFEGPGSGPGSTLKSLVKEVTTGTRTCVHFL